VAEIRDVHWGFECHRKYFTGFYRLDEGTPGENAGRDAAAAFRPMPA